MAPGSAQGWRPARRHPDPAIGILDERFARYRLTAAAVERLYTGCRWAEGPVWFGDGRYLLWSDIPNDRILKWDESTGAVSVFRQPSGFANGNTRDRQGRLLTCQHGERRVLRTEYDGSLTVLADAYQGKRLNSPNDLVVKRDGTVWFSDPPFGILGHYEGHAAEPELPTHLYRFDPRTGELRVACGDVERPNGLAFSPDERLLYVVQSTQQRRILAFDVDEGGRLSGQRVLIEPGPRGTPDGFRVDVDGNLWCGWGMGEGLDGVRVFSPQGEAIGHIHLAERCANLCFGGRARNRLFMAASQSLYALYVNAQGVAGG
ncbi:MAG TPA: SMP-30/gluconolactonase/LRE family protein [Burkholderiaceae bacterium]|nr:SMP-30/gluconolactonase/LRE family protein [Burkholderiaceae bacterium]